MEQNASMTHLHKVQVLNSQELQDAITEKYSKEQGSLIIETKEVALYGGHTIDHIVQFCLL